MFSHQPGRTFICLQCRLRILRPYVPITTTRPFAHKTRDTEDGHPLISVHDVVVEADQPSQNPRGGTYRPKNPYWPSHPPQAYPHEKKLYPHGKLRGKRGREVREAAAALPVNALGQPAEVIILRDAAIEQPDETETQPTVDPEKSSTKLSKKEILAVLARGREPLSSFEIDRQIEKLRPEAPEDQQDGLIVSRVKFEELRSGLINGFTMRQLQEYSTRNQLPASSTTGSEMAPGVAPWRHGITPIETRLSKVKFWTSPGVEIKAKQNMKLKVATKLIRDIWRIDIAEDLNAIGELEIQTSQKKFALLQVDDSSRLHDLGSKYHIKVEVFPPAYVVRITGDKDGALNALDEIMHFFKSITTRQRSMSDFQRHARPKFRRYIQPLTKERLVIASNLTKTVITSDNKGRLYITAPTYADHLEAERGIMALMNVFPESHPKLIQTRQFDQEPLLQGTISSDLPPRHLQNQNYIRYRDTIPRTGVSHTLVHSYNDMSDSKSLSKEATEAATFQGVDNTLSPNIVQKLEKVLIPKLSKKYRMHIDSASRSSASLWNQSSYYITSAVIGHILFNDHQKIPAENAKANRLSSKHIFADIVPGLSNLLSYLQKDDDFVVEGSHNSLAFRLVPQVAEHTPSLSPTAIQLPDLFIEFRLGTSLGSEQTAVFHRVTAVYEQTSADIMLTRFAADMRLKRAIIQAKETDYEDALGPSMQVWIRKTQSAITQGGRIRAHSPIVDVIIPQFLWRKGETIERAAKKDKLQMEKDVATVPYFFASVEHRQAISMNFEGFPLVLTNREGGKLGGRGYELKLSTKSLWLDSDKDKQKVERETFYQAAYRLARLVNQAARGYPPIARSFSHTSKHEQQVMSQVPDTAKESDVRISATQLSSLDGGDVTQQEHVRSAIEGVPSHFEQRAWAFGSG